MAKGKVNVLLQRLRALASKPTAAEVSDRQLLERFVRRRDEDAFAALLERHGAMVLGVCRRALGDDHLAEDVVQATFLVLARSAGSIRRGSSLGSWLHGVALRLAHRARGETARLQRGDVRPRPEPPPGPTAEACWREVRQILDEELRCLPESYRLPLVLCYLEGRTRDEAATQLGWTTARLKGLLERGRQRLRGRLIRRGLAPGAAGAVLLADNALAAPLSPLLVVSTARVARRLAAGEAIAGCGLSPAVVHLLEWGVGIMTAKTISLPLLVLVVLAMAGTGAGWLAHWSESPGRDNQNPAAPLATDRADRPPVQNVLDARETNSGAKPDAGAKSDLERIQGVWRVIAVRTAGKDTTAKWPKALEEWEIGKSILIREIGAGEIGCASRFKIDPGKQPKQIDQYPIVKSGPAERHPNLGVYELDGDVLKVCFPEGTLVEAPSAEAQMRPDELASTEANRALLITLKRVPAAQDPPGQGAPAAWRKKATLQNVTAQPAGWWKPGGLFPGFVQFAPDGQSLAAGRFAGLQTFALLDAATDKDLTDAGIARDERAEYQFLGFTAEGKAWGLREIAEGPALAGFALVDWRSGRERCRITEKGRWRAALSPDGAVLAGINVDGQVTLWDAATGKVLGAPKTQPTSHFGYLAFAPDGKTLATAGYPLRLLSAYGKDAPEDRHPKLTLWQVATRKAITTRTLKDAAAADGLSLPAMPSGHESAHALRFTPDGRRLALACRVALPGQPYAQTVLRIWDVANFKQVAQLSSREFGSLRDHAFGPRGKTVALAWMGAITAHGPSRPTEYAPAPVTIVDVASGKEVARLPASPCGYAAVAFVRNGALLATQDNRGVVTIWEPTSAK